MRSYLEIGSDVIESIVPTDKFVCIVLISGLNDFLGRGSRITVNNTLTLKERIVHIEIDSKNSQSLRIKSVYSDISGNFIEDVIPTGKYKIVLSGRALLNLACIGRFCRLSVIYLLTQYLIVTVFKSNCILSSDRRELSHKLCVGSNILRIALPTCEYVIVLGSAVFLWRNKYGSIGVFAVFYLLRVYRYPVDNVLNVKGAQFAVVNRISVVMRF